MWNLNKILLKDRLAAIALVGVYPPPYGGVSVFIKRILPYLEKEEFEYVLYNTGSSKTNHRNIIDVGWSFFAMAQIIFRSRHAVVHFNTSRWWVRVLCAIIKIITGAKVIITAHGYSLYDSYYKGGCIKRQIVRWSLSHVERIVATNSELRSRIISIGVEPQKVVTIPAFIFPLKEPSRECIPTMVRAFCAGKSPIIGANGGYVAIDGKDIYGLETIVNLTEYLLPFYPDIAIVVFIRKGVDKPNEFFRAIIEKARSQTLNDHIFLYQSSGELCHFFSICDLFLRPTRTDGDSISIREALHFGVPVIASDVVPRPEGCLLYSLDNFQDLASKIQLAISNLPSMKRMIENEPQWNAVQKWLELYSEVLRKRNDTSQRSQSSFFRRR